MDPPRSRARNSPCSSIKQNKKNITLFDSGLVPSWDGLLVLSVSGLHVLFVSVRGFLQVLWWTATREKSENMQPIPGGWSSSSQQKQPLSEYKERPMIEQVCIRSAACERKGNQKKKRESVITTECYECAVISHIAGFCGLPFHSISTIGIYLSHQEWSGHMWEASWQQLWDWYLGRGLCPSLDEILSTHPSKWRPTAEGGAGICPPGWFGRNLD